MHFTAVTPPFSQRRLARILACALLPACVTAVGARPVKPGATHPTSPGLPALPPPSTPYLVAGLSTSLRFAEPVSPAPVTPPPTVIDPLQPAGIVEAIAHLNQEAAISSSPASAATVADSSPVPDVHSPDVPPPVPPLSQPGVAILPDDTPRSIRAEDVLIYFQLPSSAPSGGQLPRSSATYQQQ